MTGRYKAYPEYKDSDVDWVSQIPAHWNFGQLSKLFEIKAGGDLKTEYFSPVLSESHPHPIYTNATDEKAVYGYTSRAFYQGNSITVSGRGDVGYAIYREQPFDAIIRLLILTPRSNIYSKFFMYFIREVIDFQVESSAIGQLSTNQISPFKVVFPDFEEQQKIANFLDHETAKIDTLIAKQEKLIELLKEKRQAVISHAVTKGLNPDVPLKDSGVEWLGEVPEHWTFIPNMRLFELTPKKSQGESKKDLSCSFSPMDKLKQDSLVLDEEKVIASVFDGYTYFENEDILMAKVTPCFENKNMVVARGMKNGIGFGSSEIYVLRCNEKVINDFMYYRLQEDIFMNIAIAAMTGAGGLKRVPAHVITSFVLALPPIEEQLKIVNSLKEKLKIFDVLSVKATGAIELMKERKTALISAAVTGKIDVRDWQPQGVQG